MERDEQGRRLWDISQPLRPGIPVWPGDTAYEEARTWTLDESCPVNVSRITLSTHTGAHADAPLHYGADGAAIGAVSLIPYLGRAQLIDVRGSGAAIAAGRVIPRLEAGIRRVILRTFDRFPHDAWPAAFAASSPDLIDALAAAGVVLIGVDAPSLDPLESKTMDAHLAVRRHGLSILEGLVLDGLEEGVYDLIAAPLALANADAAPVRAVLRELTPPR